MSQSGQPGGAGLDVVYTIPEDPVSAVQRMLGVWNAAEYMPPMENTGLDELRISRCDNSDGGSNVVRAVGVPGTAIVGAPVARIWGRLAGFTAGETVFWIGHSRGQGLV